MADLTLYTNPMSRGRIARWMLEETGVPYETRVVEFGDDGLKALNPMGKVPTITHGDVIVTEAAAICAYLADAFPDAGLAPYSGSPKRGPYYRWLFFAAGPMEAAMTNKAMGWDAPGREQMLGYGSYAMTLDALSSLLKAQDYVLGDRVSAADIYLGAAVGWGLQFGTLETRDEFRAYAERMAGRDAAIRAREIDDALIPAGEEAAG